jgi:hypothetical protein
MLHFLCGGFVGCPGTHGAYKVRTPPRGPVHPVLVPRTYHANSSILPGRAAEILIRIHLSVYYTVCAHLYQ